MRAALRCAALLAAATGFGLAAAVAGVPAPTPRPQPDPAQAAALIVDSAPAAVSAEGSARVLGALTLGASDPAFGGLSGLAVDGDGAGATFVSDRGALFRARLVWTSGRLSGLTDAERLPLRGLRGEPRPPGLDDAEGLARGPDGALLMSFEGDAPRIWRHADAQAAARPLPDADGFDRIQRNSGLEALAVAPDGSVLAIPERSGALDRPFPVWRLAPDGAAWSVGALVRRPPFLVTGADVGPDGRLYVTERSFSWLGGFSWRLSRADLDDWPDLRPVTLLEAEGGVDNVEGVSVWRDGDGRLRALLVADDNFSLLQRTVLIDVALDG
jgi:hypothetical protein